MEICLVGAQRGIRHVFFVMEIHSYKALETKYFIWAILPLNHSWKRSRLHDGTLEHQTPPKTLPSDDILQQLSHIYNFRPSKHINNIDRKKKRGPIKLDEKECFFF